MLLELQVLPVLFTSSNQRYSDLGETWEPKETLNEVKFGHYQVNVLAIGDSRASAGVHFCQSYLEKRGLEDLLITKSM